MAVIPHTFEMPESPVKPSMEIFKISYPDIFDPDEVIKYPLSSTTNTNSSIAEVSCFVYILLFCFDYITRNRESAVCYE